MSGGDYVFVVGCPRSGTTLLAVLLDRHSRLAVTPETGFFDDLAPRLRPGDEARLLDALGRWPRLPELALGAEAVVGRLAGLPWRPADVLGAILDLYAEVRGKARAGEKTPQHLRHVPAILSAFPRARVVCMLRDGRETALSLGSMPWWNGSLAGAARLWKQYVRLAEDFAARDPERFRILRYEALVRQPEASLASVMAYLGEAFEPEQVGTDRPSQVVLARSMTWKGRALDAIDVDRVDHRYRQASARERTLLQRVIGQELRRHGYGDG